MNKQAAKKKTDDFRGTYGDLINIVKADAKADDRPSTLNKALTHGQAKDVLLKGLEQHDVNTTVEIWVSDPYSPSGRMKRSMNSLIVQNVFRECT